MEPNIISASTAFWKFFSRNCNHLVVVPVVQVHGNVNAAYTGFLTRGMY
jgi:hypothetical protein